jgi:hypothetical protein
MYKLKLYFSENYCLIKTAYYYHIRCSFAVSSSILLLAKCVNGFSAVMVDEV